ncbi:ABC transporter permease, partial [candidate division KSB1 bacterium]
MKGNSTGRPPKIAKFILRIFSRSNNRSYLLGDLEENYNRISNSRGILAAKSWYWFQCLFPIPSFIRNHLFWSTIMINSYFKSMYRNLIKNKLYSFISITSLSVAIGSALSIFVILDTIFYFDAFHENAEEVYQIKTIIERNDQDEIWGNTPVPLGPALKSDYPQVKNITRISVNNGLVRGNENIFDEPIFFVEDSFLDVFTFPIKYGDKNALSERNSAIITESTAIKYFGTENALGKTISIKFDNGSTSSFIIKGVTENLPLASSFGFYILLPYEDYLDIYLEGQQNWDDITRATFIQVSSSEDLQTVKSGIEDYLKIQNGIDTDWQAQDFIFDPLLNLSKSAPETSNSLFGGISNFAGIITFFLIGFLLLILAIFNYVNIAIDSNARRLKEIAVRKVLGSKKSGIIRQFIGENVFLSIFALILGVILAQTVFIPIIGILGGTNDYEGLLFCNDLGIILFAIVVITGILGGAYPAFYISKFNPIQIMRDRIRFHGRHFFAKSLLVSQFVVSFIFITLCLVIRLNAEYQKDLDWGYNQEDLLIVPVTAENYTSLKNEVEKSPFVLKTAGAELHIGRSAVNGFIEYEGKEYEVRKYRVGPDYLESMEVRLNKGRLFTRDIRSDIEESVVVNQQFVRSLNLQNPINKRFKLKDKNYNIVGVIDDFHHSNFMSAIEPVIINLSEENS